MLCDGASETEAAALLDRYTQIFRGGERVADSVAPRPKTLVIESAK